MKAPIELTIKKDDFESLKNMIEDLKSVTSASDIKTGNFNVRFL